MTFLIFSTIIIVEFHEKWCIMQVCFIGHRQIEKAEELKKILKKITADLIQKGVTTFLFGGVGEFDHISWEVVTSIKKEYINNLRWDKKRYHTRYCSWRRKASLARATPQESYFVQYDKKESNIQ